MNDWMREIVAMLAAAKLENQRLQESMVPELTLAAVDALLREHLPYSWMASLVAALRQRAAADTSGQWSKDLLAVSIWRVVNEESRRRKMGLLSAQPATHGGPGQLQQQGQAFGMPGGLPQQTFGATYMPPRQFTGPPMGPNSQCFSCWAVGHWSKDCPRKGGGYPGKIQDIGGTPTFVSKSGRAWDTTAPPPAPCSRCRQWHWSATPCSTTQMAPPAYPAPPMPQPQQWTPTTPPSQTPYADNRLRHLGHTSTNYRRRTGPLRRT